MKIFTFLFLFYLPVAGATDYSTHQGRLDVKILLKTPNEKEKTLVSQSVQFSYNFQTKLCQIKLSEKLYLRCRFDRSSDLTTESGEVLVKNLPQLILTSEQLKILVEATGKSSKDTENLIDVILDQTRNQMKADFVLPFYVCSKCTRRASTSVVWSAFERTRSSYVEKEFAWGDFRIQGDAVWVQVRVDQIEVLPGAFQVIRENDQGSW